MKRILAFMAFSLCIHQSCTAQRNLKSYKRLPVLTSNIDTIRITIGEYNSGWIISPQIEKDSLNFNSVLPLQAKFVSDNDSISFMTKPGESHHFMVKLRNDQYAHTVIHNKADLTRINHAKNQRLPDSMQFLFDKDYGTTHYYLLLRMQYPIDSCIVDAKDDATRVVNLMNWVHHQWKHNGNQAPQKDDALSILSEAKNGSGFPCFAYAEVLRAALNSVGIPTRRLALKTKNVETQNSASGHVANEVWLRDLGKWVFIDPQENVMPYLDGEPLNAVEFQQAITRHAQKLVLRSHSSISKIDYLNFIYPYLHFLDTDFDQRYCEQPKQTNAGKRSMMLVPNQSKNPAKTGFYSNMEIDYCIYTNSLKDFYKPPVFQ